jgi:hypothetical protein
MGATRTFIRDVEVHPAANLFPEMAQPDLDALCESISRHGVRVPLVFFEGKLLDGRNRMRACVMAGIPTEKIPRRTVNGDTDPFLWAWDANCSRLDYAPAQKAAIRIKIDEASGELARLREEREEEANEARAEKQKDNDNAAKARPKNSQAPRGAPLIPPEPRKVAKDIAEKAHVSPRTVERVQKLKREDPAAFEALATKGRLPAGHPLLAKRSKAKNWTVPRAIPALAAFLRERLPSDERLDLARLLSGSETP